MPPGADINSRFEALRGAEMIMRGNWPNNPFASTVQGAPTAITASDLAAVPGPARKEFERGMDALSEAKGPQAAQHFQAAINEYPQFAAAYNNLGVALMYMKEYEKAQAIFHKALEMNSRSPLLLLNLCRADLQLQQFEEAEVLADKAATLDQTAETLAVLGATKLVNNKYEETVATAGRVHIHDKNNTWAIAHFINAKALQKLDRKQEAIAEYKQFLKEAPRSAWAPTAQAALKELGAK